MLDDSSPAQHRQSHPLVNQEYEREGLVWTPVGEGSHSDCALRLLEDPMGLLSLLEEQAQHTYSASYQGLGANCLLPLYCSLCNAQTALGYCILQHGGASHLMPPRLSRRDSRVDPTLSFVKRCTRGIVAIRE